MSVVSMLLHPLSVSVVLGGAAVALLEPRWNDITSGFFALTVKEQVSMFVLLFSLLFATSSLTLQSSSTTSTSSKDNTDDKQTNKSDAELLAKTSLGWKDYPLVAISRCTNDKERFKCVYPMLRDEFCSHFATDYKMNAESVEWCRAMLDYNVPGGKLNRGTTVLSVYTALQQARSANGIVTEREMARASVLGWSIEFLQAFFLVADDMMDDSKTRRGQPCWFRQPHVQRIAINDSFLLEAAVMFILKEHFQHDAYYTELLHLMLDVIQKTECGQLLDLTSQPLDSTQNKNNKKVDLSRFTMERYRQIVKYKTAYYSFYLPTAMGMLLAGMDSTRDAAAFSVAEQICCDMGEYFQVQDDHLDCFGDPAVIGKVGTDIQECKCSWLVVQALQRCNAGQRKTIEDNYGVWDDKKVERVKKVYRELNLTQVFEEYEESSYKKIQAQLDHKLPANMPRKVFEVLLNKIYKRSK